MSYQSTKIKCKLHIKCSPKIALRVINSSPNLVLYAKKKSRPPLNEPHKRQRLLWARIHMCCTLQWHSVIFSDEKKFNLDGPDDFAYYWHDLRKEKKYFNKRHNGGGSVMVWAAIGCYGKTIFVL